LSRSGTKAERGIEVDIAELHRRCVEGFVSKVRGISDDQWSAPTPCEDWDVRELVNHVVNEQRWTVPLMAGGTMEEVGDRFDGDLLGTDPAAVADEAGPAAVSAADDGIAAKRTVHLSFGDVPAEEYAYQLSADHLIHGWDLAAGVGGDRGLDAELVDAIAAWFAEREDLYRAAGAIGPKPEVAPDASAADKLLAAFGRSPDWKA
jgi:uncharacterized protein (TIGR03086 family)